MRLFSLPVFLVLVLGFALAGCAPSPEVSRTAPPPVAGYGEIQDGWITIPAVDPALLEGVNRRTQVLYPGPERPGTIVVDPYAKFLFLVEPGGMAMRYPIGAGRQGRSFSGTGVIRRKAEWPSWTPTANMLRTEPEYYGGFAKGIPGGPANPLGSRALYLYRGGKDTYYRIHGTNDPTSIGNATSAGCIRLFDQDIIDLYGRVPLGTQVVVRTYEQSVAAEGYELANRGQEMPLTHPDPARIYAYVEELEAQKAAYLAQ